MVNFERDSIIIFCNFFRFFLFRQKGGRPNNKLFSYVDCDSYVNVDEVIVKLIKLDIHVVVS